MLLKLGFPSLAWVVVSQDGLHRCATNGAALAHPNPLGLRGNSSANSRVMFNLKRLGVPQPLAKDVKLSQRKH
jgi:hypothetical protein